MGIEDARQDRIENVEVLQHRKLVKDLEEGYGLSDEEMVQDPATAVSVVAGDAEVDVGQDNKDVRAATGLRLN